MAMSQNFMIALFRADFIHFEVCKALRLLEFLFAVRPGSLFQDSALIYCPTAIGSNRS
jgi:hypothetical protein